MTIALAFRTERSGGRRSSGPIGWRQRDCARYPSHTTGRAVFRIRRLDPAALSDGTQRPQRRSRTLSSTVCSMGLRALRHAPTEPLACVRWYGWAFRRRNAFSRPRRLCQRCRGAGTKNSPAGCTNGSKIVTVCSAIRICSPWWTISVRRCGGRKKVRHRTRGLSKAHHCADRLANGPFPQGDPHVLRGLGNRGRP